MTVAGMAARTRVLPAFDHLRRIMVPAGIVQFCKAATPDPESGTCLDDNARAWLVAMFALSADRDFSGARPIGDAALSFLTRAQRDDGAFHNLADIRGRFVDDIGSDDSIGRAVWACGIAARCATIPDWRSAAITVLESALPAVQRLTAKHGRAYAVLGLAAALAPDTASPLRPCGRPLPESLHERVQQALVALGDGLNRDFHAFASDDWSWWSDSLTWGNARLPEAMLRAAMATGNSRYAATGLRALEFLAGLTQPSDMFVPIGNDGWYVRGGRRAKYDQQPIEACGMVDVWLAAHRLTGDETHLRQARVAFEWFEGSNSERIAVAVPQTGGCHDGLRRGSVNRNQGAESTLSYLHARFALDAALPGRSAG